jgi:predicted nucleotidyltransferase component of viral defense system
MLQLMINQVLATNSDYIGLDNVLEKEVLHHDIMLVLHKEGILQQLTFIGGTSLRLCYNSSRLSEDLDFTAGFDFNPNKFDGLEKKLEKHLQKKYNIKVNARKPQSSNFGTSTWKVTLEKFPDRKDLPSQKMHIDICALPSFDIEHRPIIDHYHINSPMAGLPIPVQSMAEILADKMVAFAYRERRIKPRDVWDIVWLKQQGVEQRYDLIIKKLEARGKKDKDFIEKINQHLSLLQKDESTKSDFYNEMSRFLPKEVAKRTLENNNFWPYLVLTIGDEVKQVTNNLSGNSPEKSFDMKM